MFSGVVMELVLIKLLRNNSVAQFSRHAFPFEFNLTGPLGEILSILNFNEIEIEIDLGKETETSIYGEALNVAEALIHLHSFRETDDEKTLEYHAGFIDVLTSSVNIPLERIGTSMEEIGPYLDPN